MCSKTRNFVVGTIAAALLVPLAPPTSSAEDRPAFVIIEVQVHDPAIFNDYAEKATEMVHSYGGSFVVMGGRTRAVEGAPPAGSVVMIRFDSYEAAERWLDSEEYARLKPMRHQSADTRQILVEAAEDGG